MLNDRDSIPVKDWIFLFADDGTGDLFRKIIVQIIMSFDLHVIIIIGHASNKTLQTYFQYEVLTAVTSGL
jgi:hypothetical protein